VNQWKCGGTKPLVGVTWINELKSTESIPYGEMFLLLFRSPCEETGKQLQSNSKDEEKRDYDRDGRYERLLEDDDED
jgi:hypothetical protein